MINIFKSIKIFSKLKKFLSNAPTDISKDIEENTLELAIDDSDFFKTDIDQPIMTNDVNDSIATQSNESDSNQSLKILSEDIIYTSTDRKLLFKVDKDSFTYPITKETKLYPYPNLPIIKDLNYTENSKSKLEKTTITCNSIPVEVPVSIEYVEVTFKPYVSYSVALYNSKPADSIPNICPLDINNLDIYSFEKDSLFLNPFVMCFPNSVPNFVPGLFSLDVKVVEPDVGFVEPILEFEDYYLYELTVRITLSLAPAIDLSFINIDTLNVLNLDLGKPSGNTLFTLLELYSFTTIDFSNLTNLDYNIFTYLINLITLNISNTNAQASLDFNKLNNLTSLEVLIARNNHFTDLTIFNSLTNLISKLKSLDIGNDDDSSTLSIVSSLDISPLFIFINLIILNLSNNNVSIIPVNISSLINLRNLNLDANNISDFSNLSTLVDLNTLSLEKNPVDPGTIGNIPGLTYLDLSNTNLDNTRLSQLALPDSLERLNISYNSISNLSVLNGLLSTISAVEIIATNQTINYGILDPFDDSSTIVFYLLLDFLLDINYGIPCIDFISNNGYCYNIDSCDCNSILWEDIYELTEAYFDFSSTDSNFTGVVNVTLDPNIPSL